MARQINTTDYSQTGSGRVAAAIWPWKCKDFTCCDLSSCCWCTARIHKLRILCNSICIIRWCICVIIVNIIIVNGSICTCQNQDGQAWDADYGDGTLYQYNYSHNNGGGSVMFCGVQAVNNIFRYNISQNDLGGVINPAGQPDAQSAAVLNLSQLYVYPTAIPHRLT